MQKTEYPKIETLYDRNPENKKSVIVGQFRDPAFALVDRWLVTEKVDGTNVRVFLDSDGGVRFGGRTDDAQMPVHLLNELHEIFNPVLLQDAFDAGSDGYPTVVLYGEGYGPKIQKGGGSYRTTPSFRLFDVRVGEWWLNWASVENIADKLGIKTVPVIERNLTTAQACDLVKCGSIVAATENRTFLQQEGVVCRTDPLLLMRNGHRLIWKLKGRDLS